ncbi:hypothetical protein ABW21_db0200550 [Orbilia brochopaga]|nr:hypothetical protein ABW21_db0200550 [Drechslerella brochopaga]
MDPSRTTRTFGIKINQKVFPLGDEEFKNMTDWRASPGSNNIFNWTQLSKREDLPAISSVLEANTSYGSWALYTSGSQWTRLHPWAVREVYDAIPSSVYFNGTYYLPCNISTTALPDIEFLAIVEGDKFRNLTTTKTDFVVQNYLHPNETGLCAGAIQNARRSIFSTTIHQKSFCDPAPAQCTILMDFGH